ncbi:hypothetical protein [Kitasatospora cystarginea]|uniref:hypothetical protein n=1 Tax=Kitasatospora cystarginea TaxID=58350 RepID=UPI0031D6B1F3
MATSSPTAARLPPAAEDGDHSARVGFVRLSAMPWKLGGDAPLTAITLVAIRA